MSGDIEVPALARVEGEGGLYIGLKDGQVVEVRLDIYEPPRFFEGFLRGRFLQEVPDITARICGICPVAYQISSISALERALGVGVTPEVRALRHLFYCGEYIESHALHVYMLQAPDLLGHESALSMADVAPDVVRRALRLRKVGNDLLRVIGGRSVHPVNACVGGFYRWPDAGSLRALLPDLEWGLEASVETLRWAATLEYPEFEVDYEFVALHHPEEYAIIEGEVRSSKGREVPVESFEKAYVESHVMRSSALHSHTVEGTPYLTGPLARLNLNHGRLRPAARRVMEEIGLHLPLQNPYKGLLARSVEIVQACDEAIDLIKAYAPKGPSRVEPAPKEAVGSGASEAPRGLLYHRYALDAEGLVTEARIVPPTSQNLARIEADLWKMGPSIVDLPHEEATLRCEHLVRAYDPCISCATHFLRLRVERRDEP